MKPVIPAIRQETLSRAEVSFLQLIELDMARKFREHGVLLRRVRRAHAYARKELGVKYPFAWLHLATDGVRILKMYQDEHPDTMIVLDEGGQLTLPNTVTEELTHFEYDESYTARWFPVSGSVPIVIDPHFGAGQPTIPGRGLTIRAIRDREKAGDTIEFIASDFRLRPEVVKTALAYADRYAA
jgi:uncharacterized protein (DUF433 family)